VNVASELWIVPINEYRFAGTPTMSGKPLPLLGAPGIPVASSNSNPGPPAARPVAANTRQSPVLTCSRVNVIAAPRDSGRGSLEVPGGTDAATNTVAGPGVRVGVGVTVLVLVGVAVGVDGGGPAAGPKISTVSDPELSP